MRTRIPTDPIKKRDWSTTSASWEGEKAINSLAEQIQTNQVEKRELKPRKL